MTQPAAHKEAPLFSDTLFANTLEAIQGAFEETMKSLLKPFEKTPLFEVLNYSLFGQAKRFRPFLVATSGDLFKVPRTYAHRVGAAVESLHTYSLIHDDLPCMDDAALRRGRPTCHKAFDEATATLAGDALVTLAFEILAAPETHPSPEVRLNLITGLSKAAGGLGMIEGQMLDLKAEKKTPSLEDITHLQNLKTGCLIAFSCEAGAILGDARDSERAALRSYGQKLGLAFQILDDLLDAKSHASVTGKSTGQDAERGKGTFVAHLGLEGAERQANHLVSEAVQALERFSSSAADLLKEAAFYNLHRRA